MTVLFRKLRLFGYGAFRSPHSKLVEAEQTLVYFIFSSHSARLGRWRTRDRKLLCQPIFAPHAMSVTYSTSQSPTRVQSGSLIIPNRFLYSIFSGGAFSHYRFAYLAVRLFPSSAGLCRSPAAFRP